MNSNSRTVATEIDTFSSKRYVRYAVFLLAVVNLVNYMDRIAISVLLPEIKKDLLLSDTQLGILTGFAFALFYAGFGIPIARWADRGCRRNIISIALVVWSVMTALSGTAQSFMHLFLARIGVGAGEAGCIPPSQSVISDYVPVAQRSGALAIHTSGAMIGTIFGFALGGWLSTQLGWRLTFLVLGIPGLIMAIIVWKTLREPLRGHADGITHTTQTLPLKETASYLLSCCTYVNLVLIIALISFTNFGLSQWLPSFYVRIYEMNTADVGLFFGVAYGLGSTLGTLGGGFFANRLTKNDMRHPLWLGGCALIVAFFVGLAMIWVSSVKWALFLNFLFTILISLPYGSVFAMIQSVVKPRMRALAAASNMLVASVIGIGGGPFCVGMLSDFLSPVYGEESLRYALILPVFVILLPFANFLLASKFLRNDLDAARSS